MARICIRTTAYNAEKTLRRAVDSVINQTHQDFIYYLLDNGSTDNGATRKIVDEYAKQDQRIKPFYNAENHVWDGQEKYVDLMYGVGDFDYYCVLDADDEYEHDFFEKALAFTRQHNLDIVACGSQSFSEQTGESLGKDYFIPNDMIIENNNFPEHFHSYHQFTCTVWGKLYPKSLLRKCCVEAVKKELIKEMIKERIAGDDVIFAMEAFSKAKRVGIMGGTLHKRYVSQNSVIALWNRNWNPKRVENDRVRADIERPFFTNKDGTISARNELHLWRCYAAALKATLTLLIRSNLGVSEKLRHLRDIFINEKTQTLIWRGHLWRVVAAKIQGRWRRGNQTNYQ